MSLDAEELIVIVNKMGGINYFPADIDERLGIAEEMASMCHTIEEAEWLASQMRRRYSKWHGVHEMRAMYCNKYRPKDGVDAFSTIYLDGIPPERPPVSAPPIFLPPTRDDLLLTAAPELEELVRDVAHATRLDRALPRPRPPVRELAPEERITQEMIDAAVEDLHQRGAKEEIGDA